MTIKNVVAICVLLCRPILYVADKIHSFIHLFDLSLCLPVEPQAPTTTTTTTSTTTSSKQIHYGNSISVPPNTDKTSVFGVSITTMTSPCRGCDHVMTTLSDNCQSSLSTGESVNYFLHMCVHLTRFSITQSDYRTRPCLKLHNE